MFMKHENNKGTELAWVCLKLLYLQLLVLENYEVATCTFMKGLDQMCGI